MALAATAGFLALAAGVTVAYTSGSYVETQLFGVKAGDWPVFGLSVPTSGTFEVRSGPLASRLSVRTLRTYH